MKKRFTFISLTILVLILFYPNNIFVYGQNSNRVGKQFPTHGSKGEITKIKKAQKEYLPKLFKSTLSQSVKIPTKDQGIQNRLADGDALDNKGKDFWVCFEQNYDGVGVSLKFFITSDVNTTCTITIPSLLWQQSYNIVAEEITTVELPNPAGILVNSSEVIEEKGIRIQSVDNIAVYGLNQREYSTDAFVGLPVDIVNLDYLIISYPSLSDDYNQSQFVIVSPYDNVSIDITPTVNTEGGHIGGQTFSITLNKGEVYQVQANTGLDLTGSVVHASLPVAVFAGNSCANVPVSCGYCDHLVEQLPPLNTWGKSFITVPLKGRENGDTFRILASQDNTSININGIDVALLNFGDCYETILAASSQIEASNPVIVMQYSNGNDWDPNISNNGDPFMMLIPPTQQFMSSYSFSTPSSGFITNYVSVTIQTDGIPSLLLDGNPLDPGLFNIIGTTRYSAAGIPIGLGSHFVKNTVGIPFGIYSYGFNDCDSYGYPGGLSLEYLYSGSAPKITLTQATIELINHTQVAGNGLTISAIIEDSEAPYTQSAYLYYKNVTAQDFTKISMINTSGNIWAAEIPSINIVEPGVKFYIYATDGQLSSTNPSISPIQNAHNIAVLPNQLPDIVHNIIKRAAPGRDILIAATITDETYQVSKAELFYRKPGGNPIYTNLEMALSGNHNYSATIPKNEVTTQGIEYYIRATDDLGTSAYHGNSDNPHTIIVTDIIPVIFIPGIMGSPLYNDNDPKDGHLTDKELIWIDKEKIKYSLGDDFLNVLQLNSAGIAPLDPNYNIMVAPLRGDASNTLSDNLDKMPLDTYKGFFNYFKTNGYTLDDTKSQIPLPNTDLFCYSYDWRKSVEWNGENLSTFIDLVLSWTGSTKVNIVAHSMGGLVTKSCVKNFNNERINKIIFVGTPHLGAPKIYYTMLTGDAELGFKYDLFINNKTTRLITRNMPSTYQLFPSDLYFNTTINDGNPGADLYSNSLVKMSYTPLISKVEYLGFEDGIQFFKKLQDNGNDLYNNNLIDLSVTVQNDLKNVDFGNIEVYNIIGFGSSTIGQVLIRYFFGMRYDHDPIYCLDGDGTVPLKSAETINGQIYDPNKTFYVNDVEHSDLPSNKTVSGIIQGLLKEPSTIQPYPLPNNYTYSNSSTWQTIIACPVVAHVYDAFGNHTGPTSDSTYEEEIPGSKYFRADLKDPKSKKIFLLPEGGSFRFEIISQDTTSSFDFRVYEITDGNLKSIVSFDSIKFEPNTRAYCQLDSISPSLNIGIDLDGNGIIDTTYHSSYNIVTSINEKKNHSIPYNFELFQNFPNPFNPISTIKYSIHEKSKVVLRVYNILGKEVAMLFDKEQNPGVYSVTFNGNNLPSGIYFYRLQAGTFVDTKKMILLK